MALAVTVRMCDTVIECDEPDGGKRGILLWRMIVYWFYRFTVVIDQACV